MKDFFKELNIIDILGIGVPGCLLVLLLGGDQTAELLWMDQFQNHPLALGIVLIIVGSLAGMLVQELGDMIEKGLWLIPWLDPKVYAACAVNTNEIDNDKMDDHKYPAPSGKTLVILKWVCGISALFVVIGASFVFPFSMWKAASVTDATAHVDYHAWLGLIPLLITAISACRYVKILPKKDTDKWKKIESLCNANPYIQTKLVGHGNTSKRTLFDGWRFVMRNLLLVWAITNLISLWKPLDFYRRVSKVMVGIRGDMTSNLFWLTLLASCAISLMIVRYFHYAFLRYKYSFEDYVELSRDKAVPVNN